MSKINDATQAWFALMVFLQMKFNLPDVVVSNEGKEYTEADGRRYWDFRVEKQALGMRAEYLVFEDGTIE